MRRILLSGPVQALAVVALGVFVVVVSLSSVIALDYRATVDHQTVADTTIIDTFTVDDAKWGVGGRLIPKFLRVWIDTYGDVDSATADSIDWIFETWTYDASGGNEWREVYKVEKSADTADYPFKVLVPWLDSCGLDYVRIIKAGDCTGCNATDSTFEGTASTNVSYVVTFDPVYER